MALIQISRTINLGVLAALACATAASADDFARPGPYAGAAGTVAFENFCCSLDADPTLGFNGRVGYRFDHRLALEIEGEWIDGFEIDDSPTKVDGWVVTVNGVVFLLSGRVQPFLSAGLGIQRARARAVGETFFKDEEFAGRVGGGFEVYVHRNVAIALDASYLFPTGDNHGLDYVRAGWGLRYRY